MLRNIIHSHFRSLLPVAAVTAAALAGVSILALKNRHASTGESTAGIPFMTALAAPGGATDDKGFAVVELFTSEGCSSCPPADDLIGKVQKESKDEAVYILAYHVDYWDRLGWKDAFSDAIYSRRQNQYASWLKLQSVYTPEVVVNGGKEFVGSEENVLRNSIRDGLQKSSPAQLTLTNVKVAGRKIDLQYHAAGAGPNTSVVLALVQHTATTQVKAGENNGRTLSHVQIVRNLKVLRMGGKGDESGQIDLPAGLGAQNAEIIAFIQNNDSGEIIAATRAAIQ